MTQQARKDIHLDATDEPRVSQWPGQQKNASSVIIIGGGLAGLATASALAPLGFRVTIVEARNRLGGRAGSFTDSTSGELIDTCQHVSMGCCTNLAHFFRKVGCAHLLQPQPCLYFMTADGNLSRFRADRWPAPFHLARSFFKTHFLSCAEKLRIAWGLACLHGCDDQHDPPFLDWLTGHRQTPRTVARFWGLVLTSALNESPDRIGLRYAKKVFQDGFLRHPRGFEIDLPMVPLGRLYGEELETWLRSHQVAVRFQCGIKELLCRADRVEGLLIRAAVDRTGSEAMSRGNLLQADWYVSTVPFDRLLAMLPEEAITRRPYFANLRNLESSPITSVHLWYDRPILKWPHVVLVDCLGQWIFNRGQTRAGDHYVQVVVSASRQFRGLAHEETGARIVAEMERIFPHAGKSHLKRFRVITEHAATFSALPGVDRWRPSQASPLTNLLVAGDWTATDWPATMEGAVRSGYLAAEALLKRLGQNTKILQPDLK